MSDETRSGAAASVRGGVASGASQLGRLIALVLWPLEWVLAPFARVFNRTAGRFVGTLTGLQLGFLVVSMALLATAPQWGEDMLRTLGLAAIFAIFAMAWDIQSGYTGYISFGHSAFAGAAGYTMGLLLAHVMPEASLWVTVPLAVLATVIVGMLIALPTLRLRGPYFSLITFVAVLLFERLIPALSQWTNGEQGLRVGAFTFDPGARYFMALVPMLAIAVVLTIVARSNVGTILVAIRENESAVSSAGINPTKFKLFSFLLSTVPMGIGGVLLALFVGRVTPVDFVIVDVSIEIIAMAIIGGMSSVLAPIGGAFAFVLLEHEYISGIGNLVPDAFDVLLFFPPDTGKWLALWLLVLAVLVFARQGLFRLLWHGLGAVGGDDE